MATSHIECGGEKSVNANSNLLNAAPPVVRAIEAMLDGKSLGNFSLGLSKNSVSLYIAAAKDGSYELSYSVILRL